MKTFRLIIISSLLLPFILLFFGSACKKESIGSNSATRFVISSPAVGTDSLLPTDYTCDGTSSCPPLQWCGFPANTACFAVIMHHIASPVDIHWYLVLYNIPANVTALPKNTKDIGSFGINSVNSRNEYAPPCSQGPGRKNYIITVYALSAKPSISVPASEVTRDVLLEAIKDITLASASMTVWYARNVK